jgi:hypothetical protein
VLTDPDVVHAATDLRTAVAGARSRLVTALALVLGEAARQDRRLG